MALLDRFRATSPAKHPDAAVRLAWMEELPMDERELIAEIARQDADPRVRRAAVGKLLEPTALASIAAEDADESVRNKAVQMLRDIALESFEGLGEPESLAAVDAIADQKVLAVIAKSASRDTVAGRALSRVAEQRTAGSIARHAALESIRMSALEALQDSEELLAVALNGEFKDSASAAVDRLTGRAVLEQIADRARNKGAVKRARARLREMDDEAVSQAAVAVTPAEPESRGPFDRMQIVERIESLAAIEDLSAAEHTLDDAEAGWASAEGIVDPELAARYGTAAETVRARVAERRADEARRAAERAELEAEAARRREEQDHVARFHAAAVAAGAAARRNARMIELADEADAAVADADAGASHRRFDLIRREWREISAGMTVDSDAAAKYADAERRLAARDADAQEHEVRIRRDALHRLQQLAARIEPLATKADLTLKAGERALRDLRMALADVPPLPSRHDYEEVTTRLKAAQSALGPKVQELREAEEWRRFANVAVQEQLIVRMQALKALDDPEEIARQIRDLQQQWRQAADVPRTQAEPLWHRFKAAHDEAWTKCEAHFAEQAQVRAANLARKTALCERAESLADSTHWVQTAQEIQALQAEWKTIGAVTRGQEKAVWDRFRSACDRFFKRRQEDLTIRKKVWAENLAKKEALCARAEALGETTDWEAAVAEIKRLQAEWKAIGPVKKTRSEAIWQRFRGACDQFFARYAQRHEIQRGERAAAREALCAELEALAVPASEEPGSTTATDAPADLLAKVRDIRRRWMQTLAAGGVERERAAALDRRFLTAFDAVIARWPTSFYNTDLDPEANRRRMEALVKRMEEIAGSAARAVPAADQSLSPTTRLAAMLKEALAANTIGGKAEDDSRWRAMADEMRQAQANWSRIGPVSDDVRRALADRFQRACRRVSDAIAKRPAVRAGG